MDPTFTFTEKHFLLNLFIKMVRKKEIKELCIVNSRYCTTQLYTYFTFTPCVFQMFFMFSILNVSNILQTSKQYNNIRGSLFLIPRGLGSSPVLWLANVLNTGLSLVHSDDRLCGDQGPQGRQNIWNRFAFIVPRVTQSSEQQTSVRGQ